MFTKACNVYSAYHRNILTIVFSSCRVVASLTVCYNDGQAVCLGGGWCWILRVVKKNAPVNLHSAMDSHISVIKIVSRKIVIVYVTVHNLSSL